MYLPNLSATSRSQHGYFYSFIYLFFKWSSTGLNSEFTLSDTDWLKKAKEPRVRNYTPIVN